MIYFIQDDRGMVKIGFTKALDVRLGSLQTGSSSPLTVLGVMDDGFKMEAALHKKFETGRLVREWFNPSAELLSFISENATRRILRDMGERIKNARLRLRFSTETMAERAGISRPTYRAIEKGDPGMSFGKYANVLLVLGIEKDMNALASDDDLGRKLQDNAPGQRVQHRKQ